MASVVGIFPDLPAVSKLVQNLGSAGYDLSTAHVLCVEDIPSYITESGVRCTWLGDVERSVAGSGTIMSNAGGINVPGLSDAHAADGMMYGDEVNDYLADLNVPDGRNDDYAVAIEAGRAVAGIRTDAAQTESLRGLFKAAGATVVDVF